MEKIPVVTLSSGSKMPQVGLGTWQVKSEEVRKMVEAAISTGYRHFDCAAIYGNEKEFGEALETEMKNGKVKREELFITSKLWNTEHHPNDVKPALEKTLSDLRLSYLDLYLVHWPLSFKLPWNPDVPELPDADIFYADIDLADTWKAMEACVREGLVRNIGLSNFNETQSQYILEHASIKPVLNQCEVHPFLDQRKLIRFCHERDIPVTAHTPFAAPESVLCQQDHPNVFKSEIIKEIAKSHGKSPAQVTLRFLIQQGCSVIPKSVRPERIRENFQIFDFELPEADMDKLFGLNQNFRVIHGKWWPQTPNMPF